MSLLGYPNNTKRRQAVAGLVIKDDRNSIVFRLRRNDISDDAFLTESGRLFHARAEATGKARSQ